MTKIIENNQVVAISKLKPNDYNPKPNYDSTPELQKEFDRIVASVKYHGQGDPIKVRELDDGSYEIMDGFHRFEALKKLGYKKVEIKNFGKLSREEAIKVTLSMEETGIEIDGIAKALLVKELSQLNVSLEGLPYTLEEIEAQVQLLDMNIEDETDGSPKERKLQEITCPSCQHTFTI